MADKSWIDGAIDKVDETPLLNEWWGQMPYSMMQAIADGKLAGFGHLAQEAYNALMRREQKPTMEGGMDQMMQDRNDLQMKLGGINKFRGS